MSIHILGLSAYYHDSAACLLRDGEIVAAAQEERFTRIKHDPSFPSNAIAYCLREGKLSAGDLDLVGFYEKPIVKFDRLLETYLAYAPSGIRSFLKAMPAWLNQKLWLSEIIQKKLGYSREILFGDHHESHAASAFYPSPFEEAAILTMDAVGEWATSSYGYGKGREMVLLKEMQFPHSLGLLYSAFTYFTGFKVNSGEYKLMGLAPYGEPTYVSLIKDHLVEIHEDGSISLNLQYFNYCAGLTMTNRVFERFFGGPPRKPEDPITQREMDLAWSIQEITEEVMLRMARHVHRETGLQNLCLAGGVALNCVGNGRILREGPFKNIWIQPAAGDAGGALGVALALWHRYLGKPRISDNPPDSDRMKGSLLGPSFSEEEIQTWLTEQGIPAQRLGREELTRAAAQHLAEGKVIGLFQSRMEFGPRALGARSILGDARSPQMQSIMNLKIKFRESFRPFAPAVLLEHVGDWFDLEAESPYMLLVADLVSSRRRPLSETDRARRGIDKVHAVRSEIPAVTHVDNSARVQTVRRETNPFFYDIIKKFFDRTGCPVIINTSFNVRGEPIVCSPKDAYQCFMRTEMDLLILENFLIEKKGQPSPNFADTLQMTLSTD